VSLLTNLLERSCSVIKVLKHFEEFRCSNPVINRIVHQYVTYQGKEHRPDRMVGTCAEHSPT
jgi:hypothetical protein